MLSVLVASLVLAAPTRYEVALRTEVRGRTPGNEGDLQLNPALSLIAPLGPISLLASYTPRILVFEPQARNTVSLLHRVRLLGEQKSRRGNRVFLDEQIAYGENSFSWLVVAAEGGQPLFDRLTQVPPLRYFSESTALGIDQALSRSLRVSATATYAVSGGADAEARSIVPLQHGPRLALNLAWAIGTRDAFLAGVAASLAYFSTGQRSYIADASAGWRHQLSSQTEVDVLLGAGAGRQLGVDESVRVYPFVGAGLRRQSLPTSRHHLAASLRVGLAPAIDPLNGSVYPRAESFATLEYSPVSRLMLAASGGAAAALSGSVSGQRLGFGALSASYELNPHFSLTAGVRFISPNLQWAGFVAASVSDRGHF